MTISPVSAAVAGALISGVAMYAVGPRAERVDAFASQPAYVQTVDGQIIPVTPAARPGYVSTLQPAAVPVAAVAPRVVTPTRTVYRAAAPAQERVVVQRERSGRSWTKTARMSSPASMSTISRIGSPWPRPPGSLSAWSV